MVDEIMKKKFLKAGIFIIVLVVGLSGCNEKNSKITVNFEKVEIINYSIEIQEHIAIDLADWRKITDGFFYTEKVERYFITGTVRDIAGYMLTQVDITVNFYDNKNNFLHSESTSISDLLNTNISTFEISYWSTTPYFQNVDYMEFNISVS